jgi:GrpB-like predicted nucleotidyltransferase (UPF0157 family)
MTGTPNRTTETVEVVPYDPAWPGIYAAERVLVLAAVGPRFVALEHMGSTSIPGLPAKPIIDMMAAIPSLHDGVALTALLATLGYQHIETSMPNRLFLRRHDPERGYVFHLHIVEHATWEERNERLLRDYLREHADVAAAYGALKQQLAAQYANDRPAYTKAKTAFIQSVVDQARDALGLPRVDVWEA